MGLLFCYKAINKQPLVSIYSDYIVTNIWTKDESCYPLRRQTLSVFTKVKEQAVELKFMRKFLKKKIQGDGSLKYIYNTARKKLH